MAVSANHDPASTAFLLVEADRGGEPRWAVKWRGADGKRVKRRLGAPAWLEHDGSGGWRPRSGRPHPGHLTERQARRAMAELIRAAEAEASERRARAARALGETERAAGPTFRDIALAWLNHLATVDDVKPSTLRNYRAMLAEPGTARLRGSGEALARIMGGLGDTLLVDVTTTQVAQLLDRVAADGVTRRTVKNPAAATPKRREDGPGRIEVFEQATLSAIASGRNVAEPNGCRSLEASDSS